MSDPRRPELPMRILFLLQRPEAWINLATVWSAMKADPAFEPVVWLLPYNASDPQTSNAKAPIARRLLESEGVPFVEWHEGMRLQPGDFDAAVFNHPYDRERPRPLWFEDVSAAVRATIYIPYGMPMGGGYKNLRLQYAQPTQARATAVVARSSFERSQYAQHCPKGDAHVHVPGLPRFDRLLESLRSPVPSQLASFIDGRKALLWNSHFSFGHQHSHGSNFSTFDLLGPELFALADRRRDQLCIIWRPHPGLLPQLIREGVLDEASLPALRSELASSGVFLDENPDHAPAFLASHALLSDPGSFLIEYLSLSRPVLALTNPQGEPPNAEARALVSAYRVATTPAEVERFIDDLLLDRCAAPPMTVREAHLPGLDGHAGQRVADLVQRLLDESPQSSWHLPEPPPSDWRPPSPEGTISPHAFSQTLQRAGRPETPLLDSLCAYLVALRSEKSLESSGFRIVLRFKKRLATSVLEWSKQYPFVLALTERFRRKPGARP